MPAIKILATAISLVCSTAAIAGDLDAPFAPTDPGSAMYTLEDVYNRMNTGATASKRTGPFVEPGLEPGSTGYNLDEVMGKAPAADNVNGVLPEGVLAGEIYWSLRTDGTWGPQAGTMPNNGVVIFSPGTADQPVDGFYSSTSKVTGDSDLTAPNIAEGVNIFNVVGTAKVATGTATDADVLKDKTFSNASGGSTGSMPDKDGANASTGQSATAGVNSFTAPTGFYDGDDTVTATDAEVRVLDSDIAAGNIISGTEIFGVPGKTEVVDTTTGDAIPAELLSGKKAWVKGLEVTGSATAGADVNGADGSKSFTIPNGLYTGDKTATASDADLVTGNIKSGASIFGVLGKPAVVDTTTGDAIAADLLSGKKAWVDGSEISGTGNISAYPALVPRTGQTTCYSAAGVVENPCVTLGQDGDVLAGEAWPNPRFHKNASGANDDGSGGGIAGDGICNGSETCNGSVTDNLTGLVWLENANCFGAKNWATALTDANGLADGTCGLSDSSAAGDWHLPNRNELNSLIDSEYFNPALSNAAGTAKWTGGDAFSDVVSDYYWLSTAYAANAEHAWFVYLNFGRVGYVSKTTSYYVWPVRAGQ